MVVNEEFDKFEYIIVGMKLRIPVDAPEQAEPESAEARGESADDRSEGGAKTYTVKQGDNLYRIAQKTLGDGERFKVIYQANKQQLSSPNAIRPGMKLTLPNR